MASRAADKESFYLVPETCPHVDAALEAASSAIKVQTGKLREALSDAIDRAFEAEGKLADAEKEIETLRDKIEELKSELLQFEAAA